jgi:putative chitinase
LELDDFVREILHESGMLERLEENLNYSVEALLAKFGRHRISEADARRYGRIAGVQRANPEAIANAIYGGVWGAKNLGNTEPGSGWRNRGAGLLQITGAANMRAVQAATGVPVYDHPELLRTPSPECLKVCIAWWEKNVPDDVMGNIAMVRKEVNGGNFGLAEDIALDGKVKGALT